MKNEFTEIGIPLAAGAAAWCTLVCVIVHIGVICHVYRQPIWKIDPFENLHPRKRCTHKFILLFVDNNHYYHVERE